MNIILDGHNEEYAVREIVNSYFPKTKLLFNEGSGDYNDYIHSSVEAEDNKYTYKTKCFVNNAFAEKEIISDSFSKNKIKKSISDCLKEITGLTLPWGLLTGIRPPKIAREFLNSDKALKYNNSVIEFLKNEYEVSELKARLCQVVEKKESEIIKNIYPDGISLYIGIPFCPTRCLYCSFTSQSIAYSNKLTEPFTDCLIKEIKEISKLDYIKKHTIETVYFGGGTPTALNENQIDRILNALYSSFDLSNIKEFTFEAGRPDTITAEKLKILQKYNISRISINPQTSKDETLKIIGRNHTNKDFQEAFYLAREMGFSHINCDIIAGLPNETINDFENTLLSLCDLSPESITIHTMCIKHGSFLDMKYDMYTLTAAETVNSMLNIAQKYVASLNMNPYYLYRQKNMLGNLENVGYSLPNKECLYNIYIMEEVQSIIALGGGASTKIISENTIERSFNVKEVSEYIRRIDEMITRKINFLETF